MSAVLLLLLNMPFFASAAPTSTTYCVPVPKIDLNPFREIVDGKDMAYLLLMRSFISNDPAEPGILKNYEFSPDGKIFTARINQDLRWQDGSAITPSEVALVLAKTLTYRPLGQRVKVKGTEQINASSDWAKKSYSGIQVLNASTFQLNLESNIKNLTGVFREALTTNSWHNRFWLIRLDHPLANGVPEVLAKFPQVTGSGESGLLVDGEKVLFISGENCGDPDYSIFRDTIKDQSQYQYRLRRNASAITLQPNIPQLDKAKRQALTGWFRSVIKSISTDVALVPVDSFFLKGESGYSPKIKWSDQADLSTLKKIKLVIAYENPIFRTYFEKPSADAGLNIEWVALPNKRSNIDAQILASGILEGRHLILQDFLQWEHVSSFIEGAPRTVKQLKKIARLSASTIPPDVETLQAFEVAAASEVSLAPLARRHPTAFTKKGAPLILQWTKRDELSFVKSP